MKRTDALGQFEQLVLTAVLLRQQKAYGIAVHEKVEELRERRVKLPSVYVTLEEKGTSNPGWPIPRRRVGEEASVIFGYLLRASVRWRC